MGELYHHLTYNDRLKIEALLLAKTPKKEIARIIGVHISTIYREVKRGTYIHRNSDWTEEERYCPEQAEERYREELKEKGIGLKIGNDWELIRYIENKIINEKYSPYAALAEIKRGGLEFSTTICLTTAYNYIKNGVFPNIELAEHMPYKRRKGKKKKKVQKRASKGTSIEQRPKEIDLREEVGHWEMDTVVGKQGESHKCMLVLTERKTRIEIVEDLKRHTAEEVVKALDRMERKLGEKKFREIFKTITIDNGPEFADFDGLERSRRNKKKRTKVFYCHPYTSSERGSNENQNKLVRRHVPKGTNFDAYNRKQFKEIEYWINTYPRELFEDMTAAEIYQMEFGEEFWRLAG